MIWFFFCSSAWLRASSALMLVLPFLRLPPQGDVPEHAQQQRPALFHFNEAVRQLEVHRLAGSEGDVPLQLAVNPSIRKVPLVGPQHFRQILAFRVRTP